MNETPELAKALAKAQASFPAIERTRTVTVTTKSGGSYSFAYAPLDKIRESLRDPLSENGLSVAQLLTTTLDGAPALRTVLLHASGESIESVFPFPVYGNLDAQGWGSLITYFRRYALVALLGIATEEDDDGNNASGNTISGGAVASGASPAPPLPSSPENPAAQAQAAQAASRNVPEDDGKPENVLITFGKKYNGQTLGEAGEGYWKWLDENFEARNAEQRRILEAARMLLGMGTPLSGPDDDIPFAPVPA